MSSRNWIPLAFRQCQNAFSRNLRHQHLQRQHQQTSFSTTSSVAALRGETPSSRLTDLAADSDSANHTLRSMLNDSLSNSASFSYRKRGGDRRGGMSGTTRDDLANSAKSEAYLAFMPRRWKKGEVYSPRDLKAEEQNRWRYSKGRNLPPIQNAERRKKVPDAVDTLGFNPLDNYRNFTLISEYMSSFGNIKHNLDTGLRPVNQRKMAKAIRRAVGMGLHPSVHLHPELLVQKNRWLPHAILPTTNLTRKNTGL